MTARASMAPHRSAAGGALLLAAMPLVAAVAQPAPFAGELPGIDEARIAIPSGRLGAHAVTVSEVRSRLAPSEALAEVERHWRAQSADPVLRAEAGNWSVLSRRYVGNTPGASSRQHGRGVETFETLQLRRAAQGGSEGLVTLWQPQESGERALRTEALLPEGARIVRQLASNDSDGRTAQTLIAHFDRTLEDTEAHVDRHLLRNGFTPMRHEARTSTMHWTDDRARFYAGNGAELLVTLHRQPRGTDVVVHHVEMPR